eukprot:364787-Chlamydomonas_euryale.AAC.1
MSRTQPLHVTHPPTRLQTQTQSTSSHPPTYKHRHKAQTHTRTQTPTHLERHVGVGAGAAYVGRFDLHLVLVLPIGGDARYEGLPAAGLALLGRLLQPLVTWKAVRLLRRRVEHVHLLQVPRSPEARVVVPDHDALDVADVDALDDKHVAVAALKVVAVRLQAVLADRALVPVQLDKHVGVRASAADVRRVHTDLVVLQRAGRACNAVAEDVVVQAVVLVQPVVEGESVELRLAAFARRGVQGVPASERGRSRALFAGGVGCSSKGGNAAPRRAIQQTKRMKRHGGGEGRMKWMDGMQS